MKNKVAFALGALLLTQGAWAASYSLKVTEKGFEPGTLTVEPGQEVTLKVTRTTNATCAKKIVVPSKKLKADLPLGKEVTLALGTLQQGEIRFTCGMNMVGGVILAK